MRQVIVCTELHTYQCKQCKTVMVTPLKLKPGEPRYRCVSCYGSMWFLFSSAITTEHEKALARRGAVYNPHIQLCPICGERGYAMYRGRPGDNRMYCSAAHADASIPRTDEAAEAERKAEIRRLAQEEQSINQRVKQ